jgi:Trypsin-co-occurring domain 1
VAELLRFEGEDGSFMLIETTRLGSISDVGLVSDETGLARATTKLEDSLGSVRGAAVALLSTVNEVKGRHGTVELHEVSLELGLSFGAQGGVVVARGSANVEASVSITWRASERTDEA